MKKLNFRKMLGLAIIFPFLWITSCNKKEKDEHSVPGGTAAVKINFMGDAYDEDTPDTKASARSTKAEKTTVMIDPSNYISIEAVPTIAPKARAADRAAFTGVLRVVAYDNSDGGKYKAHKDYMIMNGVPVAGDNLLLDGGVSYTMVAYANEVSMLPILSTTTTFDATNLSYDYNEGKDLMYFINTNFVPEGGADKINILNILLKHKVALITANLNTKGELIKSVKDIIISPNDRHGKFSFKSGSFTETNTPVGAIPGLSYSNATGSTNVPFPIFVNGEATTPEGKFGATINIDGTERTIITEAFFTITRGKKKNLNINFNMTADGCGAYFGPNKTVWREVACYNMFAVENRSPFVPHVDLQGAKFKWGNSVSIGESSGMKNKNDNTNGSIHQTGGGVKSGWNDTKGTQDPCPTGYQVMTMADFNNLFQYNAISETGNTWGPNSFEAGFMVGEKLMLPAAGFREFKAGGGVNSMDVGNIKDRGVQAWYWAGTPYSLGTSYYGIMANIRQNKTFWVSATRTDIKSTPIRCIKMK
ncbi:hypothetical protein [Sphingobacterium sp. GVS05A]|uniref:hypothetical protein n=1 Tax=Sphingobacterium sp. GVS05A TaxID=2862679 RepID=UPI001CBC3820|nr:hypothetical protein [Sphingobacterium sp. GVS05A]